MEPVPAAHIEKLNITTDLESVGVNVGTSGTADERAVVFVSEPAGRVVAVASGAAGQTIRLPIPSPHPWSPENPYLYTLKVALLRPSGNVVDVISSYAGLRTVGTVTARHGRHRIAVNGKITFLHGPLYKG